jgi:hypothetical protein
MLDQAISPATAALTLRSTISAAVLDEGAVLLDLESKYFYALNAGGWAIVQLFEAGSTVDGVVEHTRAWGAPDDGAVAAFIESLRSYDLLEPAAGAVDETDISWTGTWIRPTIERQAQPLQTVMVSAFDPSIPLAE